MELNKRNMKKIMVLIVFAVAFYMLVKNLYLVPAFFDALMNIVGPVLAGFAAAFVVNVLMLQVENRLFAPLNRRFKKRWPKVRRGLSILLSLLIIFGLITLLLFFVIPELANTIKNLTDSLPSALTNLQGIISAFFAQHPEVAHYADSLNINWANISNLLSSYGQGIASSLINWTISATTGLFRGAVSLVLAIVIAINTLAQKEKLIAQIKKVLYAYLPRKHADSVRHVFRLTSRAFYNCITGTMTEACILGTLCFIGMRIFQFPYAILISVLAAFNALIPIIGAFLSTVIGALLIATVDPLLGVWYVIYFCVLQQLEGNLIYPRVVGSRVGLPVLWMLIAITIGGNACGVLGMIINIPICSVLYTLLREDVRVRTASVSAVSEDETAPSETPEEPDGSEEPQPPEN
jgi:predicted PurR-regulated permease PerM